jgi:predicted aconitase with swiveling domain
MVAKFSFKGSSGCKGVVEGEALVCRQLFVFRGVTDVQSGIVTAPGHELSGKSVRDKIMVLSNGCGPSTEEWSFYIRQKLGGANPKAVVYTTTFPYPCSTIGNIIAGIPMVYGFGEKLFEIINNGDWIKVDADRGIIEVSKKE